MEENKAEEKQYTKEELDKLEKKDLIEIIMKGKRGTK